MSAKDKRKGSVADSLGDELGALFGEEPGVPKQQRTSGDKEAPTEPAAPRKPKAGNPPQAEEEAAPDLQENTSKGSDLDPGLAMMLRTARGKKNLASTSYRLVNQGVLPLICLAIKSHTDDAVKINNTKILERLVEMARQELLAKGTKSKVFKCLATEIEKAGE
jgi:hypothetical protein